MNTRLLPPDEWPRLVGTELETVYPRMTPGLDAVMVVEDEGEIIACWASILMRHLEGVWIAPAHRGKSSAARRLLVGMGKYVGGGGVMTGAGSEEVRAMLERLGAVKVPVDQYVFALGGK